MSDKCSTCRVVACQRCKAPRSRRTRRAKPVRTKTLKIAILVLGLGPCSVTPSAASVAVEPAGAADLPAFCPPEQTYPHPSLPGLNCDFCPPGHYVERDCTRHSPGSVCAPCPQGKYQPCPTSNTRCHPCSDCGEFLPGDGRFGPPLEPCSPSQDNVCRCPQDGYWSPEEPGCKATTPCAPGEGVAHQATHKSDTVCIACQDGFYSSEASRLQVCQECSRCEETLQPCTRTNNTVCIQAAVKNVTSAPLPSASVQQQEGLIWWEITLIILGVGGLLAVVGIVVCVTWKRRGNGAVPNTAVNGAARAAVTYYPANGAVYTAVPPPSPNGAVPGAVPSPNGAVPPAPYNAAIHNGAVPGATVTAPANAAVHNAAVPHALQNTTVPGVDPPPPYNGAVPGAAVQPAPQNGAIPAAIPPLSANAAVHGAIPHPPTTTAAVPGAAVPPPSAYGAVPGAVTPSPANAAVHHAIPHPPTITINAAVPPPSAAVHSAVLDQPQDNCDPIGQPSSAVIRQPSSTMQQPESSPVSREAEAVPAGQPQSSSFPRQENLDSPVVVQQPDSAAGSGQPSTTFAACQPSSAVPSAGPTGYRNMQQDAPSRHDAWHGDTRYVSNDSANQDSWTDPKAAIQGHPVPDTHDQEGNLGDLDQKDAHDAVEELPVNRNRANRARSSTDVDAIQDSKDPPNNADDALEKEAREPVQVAEGAAGSLPTRLGPYGSSNQDIPAAALTTHR